MNTPWKKWLEVIEIFGQKLLPHALLDEKKIEME